MKIICLVAPSCGGKDTILKHLVNENIVKEVVSYTSRPMRKGETNGKEYNFITKENMLEMINNNEFIETRYYNVASGDIWYYGLHKNSFDINSDNTYGVILDFQGLKQLEQYLESINQSKDLISIYINVPLQERLRRSISREGDMTDNQCLEVCRRAIDDNEKVVPAKHYCNYVVDNYGGLALDNVVNFIIDILQEEE